MTIKKKRGLRRYYKKLNDSFFVERLNLGGNDTFWFDLFHFHIDNEGLGNKSWKSRIQHLDALFEIAGKLETKLTGYSKKFQFWIEISESDSREDAIYLHTKNPMEQRFRYQLVLTTEKHLIPDWQSTSLSKIMQSKPKQYLAIQVVKKSCFF